jgi:hypothetical protein
VITFDSISLLFSRLKFSLFFQVSIRDGIEYYNFNARAVSVFNYFILFEYCFESIERLMSQSNKNSSNQDTFVVNNDRLSACFVISSRILNIF